MYKKFKTERDLKDFVKTFETNVGCCVRVDNNVVLSTIFDLELLNFEKRNKYIELLINKD